MPAPPYPDIEDRVARVLGWRPTSWTGVTGGYTPAARYVVRRGTESAFVKLATNPVTITMMRREFIAYDALRGSFMPHLFGYEDDETHPLLVIEDLGQADWPPPWNESRVQAVLDAMAELHASTATLPAHGDVHGHREPGWRMIAEDPGCFLGLGLASREWLDRSLPALLEAEDACRFDGSAPTHWDLRSDNLCFVEGKVKIVDWAEACLSNPRVDIGFWLPSLAHEGGPQPEDILPDAPEIAAWVAGFFAARAGQPDIPQAPFVRRVQREQLSTALPWVQRALGLPQLQNRGP